MEQSGRILIVTTNKIEVFDEAFIRNGRINRIVQFTLSTHDDIKNILKLHYPNNMLDIDELVLTDVEISPAKLTDYCLQHNYDECVTYLLNN